MYSESKYAIASVPCKARSVPKERAMLSSSVQAASQVNRINGEEKKFITWTPGFLEVSGYFKLRVAV
jgi:hypothetical protein